MEQTRLVVSEHLWLSLVEPADKGALVQHLNDHRIYETTLRIPHRYSGADAEKWIREVAAREPSES